MPKTRTPKKNWSKILEESGLKVRIYERPGSSSIWCSIVLKEPSDVRMARAKSKGRRKDLV